MDLQGHMVDFADKVISGQIYNDQMPGSLGLDAIEPREPGLRLELPLERSQGLVDWGVRLIIQNGLAEVGTKVD